MKRHLTRHALGWPRRVISAEWQGPADLPQSLTMEWRLVFVRWVGVLAVAPALPLMHLPNNRLIASVAILVFAIAYNWSVRRYIQRRPDVFANGYLTTVCDSFLNMAMVLVGGGFDSAFSYVLFTVMISVAMRYGYGPSLAMTMIFTGTDAIEHVIGHQSADAAFAFRTGFLFITALLASYLRSLTVKAEVALHDRLIELQRLYSDLAVAHQELLSLDEAKTNFLANVSHELRTPLTSIRAFSEILQSYPDDEDTQQEFLQIITAESERLTRLVNDVLDVTKIESGEMDWRDEAVDPSALLDQCARTFAPLFEHSTLEFEQDVAANLPEIRGDHDRIQQVIHNLLNNAMKFTSEGTIRLHAGVQGDELWIEVSDTGVGIAAQDQERVFEKFQQVGDTLTGKPKGTGLGLTICRDIVAHHGGRLMLDSQPGRGSRFSIVLPVPPAVTEPIALPAAA
ncbi:MAG: HAMP domain-containing histidine kinase [Chloroflexi bacterium]|nr:HAMP domain-containing histidine kinase [Chloroflexota bacterium]